MRGMVSSYETMLGGNMPTRNDKNVMEIVLEKDEKGVFNETEEEVAKALTKLGADLHPLGVHVESVQICPMGRNMIQVTLNKNVDIARFCNKEVFEIKEGLRISPVRQSGKREVILTIKGLHPNTMEETVFKYLNCIGKVEKKKVIMDTYKEGPLAGIQNGTRKYTIEVRPDLAVGTSHFIDGCKVNFSYPGQKKFCFRCLRIDRECVGRGLAKVCEENGGFRVPFSDYITEFWKKIKYSPEENLLPTEIEAENGFEVQIGGNFTPKQAVAKPGPTNNNKNNYGAVSVNWFPKQADPGDIKQFLVELGLPCDHDNLNIKDNGQVIIADLTPDLCEKLSESITGQKFKNRKMIYCQPIELATPEKVPNSSVNTSPTSSGSISVSAAHFNPSSISIPASTAVGMSPSTSVPSTTQVASITTVASSSSSTTKVAASTTVPSSSISSIPSVLKPKSSQANASQKNAEDFTFSPRPKSKFFGGSSSESDKEQISASDYPVDESEHWLTMNDKKRSKRQKRKQPDCAPDLNSFKKQDKKPTPKAKKN